jgi:hypothetical protein
MRMFSHTIRIDRSPEAVFDFFTDFSKAPMWRAFVRTMELVGPGPVRAGSTVRCVMDLNGAEQVFDLEILACARPSLWRHRTNETDLRGFIEYRFEPDGSGTRVTMTGVAQPATLYGWLAMPLVWLRRGMAYREQLPGLKAAMEQTAQRRGGPVGS